MRQLYVIHGFESNPNANWFPWLKRTAERGSDWKVDVLPMPDSFHPDPRAWDRACDEMIEADAGITIVGHSLGCIQAVRFVERHALSDVDLLLVSGFDEPLPAIPQLAAFTEPPVDYREVLPKIRRAVVVSACDDDQVPFVCTQALARHLHAPFVLLPEGRHFTGQQGCTELPVVADILNTF